MRLLAASMLLLLSAGFAAAQDQAAPSPAPEPPPLQVPTNPPMTGPKLLLQTSMGDITLQLDSAHAPKTVANILRYVREKHYDGTVIYRVVKGFVLEMGSWDAQVKGRPVHPGIPLEASNGLKNLRYTISLAHGDDPASGQADFFINLDDNTALDPTPGDATRPGYAVFGQVVDGMDVVDKAALVPVGDKGPMPGAAPIDPIVIKSVTVIGDPPPKPAGKASSLPKKK